MIVVDSCKVNYQTLLITYLKLIIRIGKHVWRENFFETSLRPKEAFYSELNLQGISDGDYAHAQKVWEAFEINNHGEYHDMYVQSDTLLLADVFEDFKETCIEIYGFDPSHFLYAPGLAWQACLKKKTNVNLELLTDMYVMLIFNYVSMLLMIEAGTGGGMCQLIHST